jgi:hypothetical protein
MRNQLLWYFYYCYINCYLLNLHQPKNKWVKKSATNQTHGPSDDITTYLSDPVLASDAIAEVGGYMKYWHLASQRRPCLAKMGSDFCSVPGKCTLLCDVFRPSHVF